MNAVRFATRLVQLTSHISPTTIRTMSTTSTAKPAPWRAAFLEDVSEMASPEFTLATLHSSSSDPNSSSSSSSTSPRLRTVIFRGLWANLPVNPKNTAELNPPVFDSDVLTITTDARMSKVADFYASPPSAGKGPSGGGAPVEACFWTPSKVQWRVRGTAYIIGPDIASSSAASVRERLQSHMRPVPPSESETRRRDLDDAVRHNVVSGSKGDGDGDSWSFERELTAHFGNLSPGMRGSFRNPEPGTPRAADGPPDEDHRLGQKVTDLHDEIARQNFRVVAVVPTEVDQTDLSDAEDPRRWLYRFVGAEAGWEKTELWP
ncbi:hypothetical protein C8035_v007493 [Colletotrichum spinosum]|uniref:Pyridoxamine 5'-phosphate oxidase Alr4036 family FMN-binding domain-containing protein n=1 Tax=Colletotrichum spinosum TaxID=1347390 RepID=A0A4R8PRV5_9PEZI|nr:hypothetical protein C8035_v007493 [Colletotrichum spinosum]